MRLQEYIKSKEDENINSIYDARNLKWKRTIIDHKDYLIRIGSFIEKVNFEKNISFKYNLKYFIDIKVLEKNSNIKRNEVLWIVKILNDIDDDNDFINKDFIYVPNIEILNDLYEQFIRE